MSMLTEDRLRAALRARAEQVAPEDLRPPEVPQPPRRSWKPVLAGLAAAAVVASLVPVLLGRDADPEPDPATRAQLLRLDLDGDGGPDEARLTYDPATKRYAVTVRRYDGPTLRVSGSAEDRPRLLADADLNGDHRTQLVVRVSDDPAVLPDVYHYVAGDGLVHAVPASPGPAGWQVEPTTGWALSQGRLYVWSSFPDRLGASTLVQRWTMRARGEVLTPTRSLLACLPDGASVPVSCASVTLDKTVRGRADVDGDGRRDRVELTYASRGDEAVTGDFELAVTTAAGSTYSLRTRTSGGSTPVLEAPVSLSATRSQQVLISASGGDSDTALVFAVADGALEQVLPVRGSPPLVSSWDRQGRLLRYWVDDGELYSLRTASAATPDGNGRALADRWRWSLVAEGGRPVLRAEPLGQRCFFLEGETPEPC